MKFNTRILALAVASAGTVAANAQNVTYWLAYGDSQLVTLAKSVQFGGGPRDAAADIGKAIPTDRALRIPKIADNLKFTLQVWVTVGSTSLTSTGNATAGGAGFVSIDRGSASNTSSFANDAAFASAALDKKLSFGSGKLKNFATGLPGQDANGATTVNVGYASGSTTLTGAFGASGTSVRSIGAGFAMGFGTGLSFVPVAGESYRLFDVEVQNTGLANFDVYGDASSENGIKLNSFANATSRSNFLLANPRANGNPGADKAYSVEAVPEPGSIIAIAAGLVALAGRRRK